MTIPFVIVMSKLYGIGWVPVYCADRTIGIRKSEQSAYRDRYSASLLYKSGGNGPLGGEVLTSTSQADFFSPRECR